MLRVVTGHGDIVDSVYFDSKDMLVSGSWDKTIKLWNKNTDVNKNTTALKTELKYNKYYFLIIISIIVFCEIKII